MSPIVIQILGLIAAAPSAIAEIQALWNTVKGGFGAKDVATVDGILAFLNPKLDTDIVALHTAATARG